MEIGREVGGRGDEQERREEIELELMRGSNEERRIKSTDGWRKRKGKSGIESLRERMTGSIL